MTKEHVLVSPVRSGVTKEHVLVSPVRSGVTKASSVVGCFVAIVGAQHVAYVST